MLMLLLLPSSWEVKIVDWVAGDEATPTKNSAVSTAAVVVAPTSSEASVEFFRSILRYGGRLALFFCTVGSELAQK